ncbi:hypothetical protein C0991_011575, partial [Blastosporella zonata]
MRKRILIIRRYIYNIIRRYIYNITVALAYKPPLELRHWNLKQPLDIQFFTSTLSLHYVCSFDVPRLRLVSLTAVKRPLRNKPSQHEFISVCLCDANGKNYYIQLHRSKFGSPVDDVAVLVPGAPGYGYTNLSCLEFPKDTQLTLLDAMVIASTVCLEIPEYRLVNSNCFTQLIMTLAESELGGVRVDRVQSSQAGRTLGLPLSTYDKTEHLAYAKAHYPAVRERVYER